MIRIPLYVTAIPLVIFVCGSFVESISIVMQVSGARVPIVDVFPGARVPNVVLIPGVRVPESVVFSDVRVPNVVVIPGASVPESVVFSDARVPNVVVIPDVRHRAARRFHGLVLAHWRWLESKFRAQSDWYSCGRVRRARRGSVDVVRSWEVHGVTLLQELCEPRVHCLQAPLLLVSCWTSLRHQRNSLEFLLPSPDNDFHVTGCDWDGRSRVS